MTLKAFPRGGKKPEDKPSIFKKHEGIHKKKRDKGRSRKLNEEEDNLVASTAERLSYMTVSEGLIVLGCVFEVTEYDLIISLPGGIIGRAQVTDINDSYTNLLQNLIQAKDALSNEFKPLPELYSCGDYVVCYVKSIQPHERWQVALSLDPRFINQNLDINYLNNNSKIICTITSVEDHGYVVDTGLASIRGFIPTQEDSGGKPLYPGKQLLCSVKEIKTSESTSTVTLSIKPKYVKTVNCTEVKSLDALTPGTKFNLYVKSVLSNGLCVSYGNDHIGYINQLYLDQPLAKYITGMEVTGTLLYILPTVKFGYFSLSVNKSRNNAIKPGDVVEEATALFRESGGVALQLMNEARGLVPLKRTNVDYDKIIEKFVPGSKHKCRVLSYSWMDGVYICTMEHSLLEQKYFSISDFKAGDIVNVKITSINAESGFVNVQVGKINGQVAPEHVSDEGISVIKKLKVDKTIEARVLAINNEKKKIYFTLKKSLLTSKLPVLSDLREAKVGPKYHGTVVQINNKGLLVKFYGDVKGWVPKTALGMDASDVNWNYSIGQTILVQIESLDENLGKMILTVPMTEQTKMEEIEFIIGEHVEGTIVESSIQGVYLRISKNDGQKVSTGYLPAGHMAPCPETASLLASRCIPGDTLSAVVFATVPSLILTRTFLSQVEYRSFERLKIGDCIPCSIRDIEPDGIRVILPVAGCTSLGFVSYSNVNNFNLLLANQILIGKVISINRKEKQVHLSLALKKIYDELVDSHSRSMAAVDNLSLYFNKLAELASNPFYDNRLISSVSLGQRVTGKIDKIMDSGLVIKLKNNLQGVVSKDHYSGDRKVGETVTATVIWKNYVHEFVELTMLPSVMNVISCKQNKQMQILEGKVVRGTILMVTNWFVLLVLKGRGKGSLAAMPVKRHVNDIQADLSPYKVHLKIRCYVILNADRSDIMPICMLKSAFEKKRAMETKTSTNASTKTLKRKKTSSESQDIPLKKIKVEKVQPEEESKNKDGIKRSKSLKKSQQPATLEHEPSQKKTKDKSDVGRSNKENAVKPKADSKKKNVGKKKKEETPQEMKVEIKEEPDIKPFEDIVRNANADVKDEEKPRIPECGFFWDDKPDLNLVHKESSSDSEDEAGQQPKQKKKKLSAAERREQERQKERAIRQKEEALASNQLPNSVDQFDRLVLGSPNSSIIWLQYMAYHLQSTEIDKARSVARRAVKTINFREETERLNVWNGWLNLESKFGTPESLNDVFQEAVRCNDALKIYTHMLTVHMEAGRQFELEKVVNTMVGKFKQNPQVWIECGSTLLKMGLKEKSRHIMQRALQSLPASEHVNLMARFATLENKFGDKERAQTLFEQILSSYPKRVDVWSCYVDSLVKTNDIDIARKVLERAVVQSLPPRKMRSLFKKFISFEEQHGTQQEVERIQRMAVEYVEKQCSKEEYEI